MCYWVESYRLDPWGEERGDLRAGVVAAAITNGITGIAAGMAGQRSFETVSPADYMLRFGGEEESDNGYIQSSSSRRIHPITDQAEWENLVAVVKSRAIAKG